MMVLFNDPTREPSTMNMISTIGLDIAKNSFSVHGFDAGGVTVLTKDFEADAGQNDKLRLIVLF